MLAKGQTARQWDQQCDPRSHAHYHHCRRWGCAHTSHSQAQIAAPGDANGPRVALISAGAAKGLLSQSVEN